MAAMGPGYLIAVGYMDPGNWATDLASGSRFGYALLPVVIGASMAAMLLQYLALKLGLATGKSLSEHCREHFPTPITIALWMSAETMIIACDMAEVIGTAIALNLLFGLPLIYGVILTAADTLLFLALRRRGLRTLESLVMVAVITVVGCFVAEMYLIPTHLQAILTGLGGSTELFHSKDMLYLAVGIMGATIMPHNLYLHSEVAKQHRNRRPIGEAIRLMTTDSTFALFLAAFVNCAILLLAVGAFYATGQNNVVDISQAYHLLSPVVGTSLAAILFAIALLLTGQTSTITATMAGESIMQGFLGLRAKPWMRRLITRCLAIIPAVVIILWQGDTGIGRLLITSQVVLSMQLPLAIIPLLMFTNKAGIMGSYKNKPLLMVAVSTLAIVIIAANCWMVTKLV
jgi:manganese transport protein